MQGFSLFKTEDNVSLWLQIVAVALAIAIFVTGGAMLIWESIVGKMYEGPYDASQGVGLDSTITEGECSIGDFVDAPTETPTTSQEPDDPLSGSIGEDKLSDLNANIKNWMNNGSPVRESYVTNILLIGNDENKTNSRADAMMILSINHHTKTITLASILRDQYSYVVANGTGRFEKFHHACARGGPALQIQMIERYYKVVIDNYATANFESLATMIDIIGGIEVTLTNTEAKYLHDEWDCPRLTSGGTYVLNGHEALMYCRIRKGNTGGATARVSRQQELFTKLIGMAGELSRTQLISLVNALIPHIRTGLSSTDILGYAITALTDGWFDYEIKRVTLPDDNCATGMTVSGLWYWKVDFPVAAQKLQKALYGSTNITLAPGRKSWIK